MVDDYDQAFKEITDIETSKEANSLLRRHLSKAQEWRLQQINLGNTPSQHDFTKHLLSERNARGPVIVAYAAALWKMMEETDGKH